MAFDQATRNRLQKFVGDARKLLSDEFTQQLQNTYGLDPVTGGVAALSDLPALSPSEQQTAQLLRDTLEHYLAASHNADPHKDKALVTAALDRIVREQAFTVLNRLAALRMAEARQFVMESISQGYQSKGFQLYQRIAGSSLGETGQAYQTYLFSVFDELSLDLAILFDRYSAQGRLFPRETVLIELLDLINHAELELLWAEDETVGWIYQYFNSKEERKKMRDESQAPRNSRELAVRNQFFTPRYVVEFLTDNTLGRIWYEMTKGKTSLVDSCEYLVRRPNEVFLEEGEAAPEQENEATADLSREELLQQIVHIQHRPLKDPRDIKMLDPACGSMHFGLYAFDLFENIYSEAWDIEAEFGYEKFNYPNVNEDESKLLEVKSLHQSYESKESYLADVPKLIIEHNIHGVDIDPRAAQIAGLSLWLRAQKSWSDNAIKPNERPQVQRSNIVCAEPMPGEKELLKEFASQIQPRVLGQLVEEIFEKMELAGETGTLLKIEEEIQSAIEDAKSQKDENILEVQGGLFGENKWEARTGKRYYNFGDVGDDFWGQAEQLILSQLERYAEVATGEGSGQKRLFASDAAKGFSFIDLSRKRFDVVLMNPPFGSATKRGTQYLKDAYPKSYYDIYAAFIDGMVHKLADLGMVGSLTSKTFFSASRLYGLRRWMLEDISIDYCADLGGGVLDNATVETAAYVLSKCNTNKCVTFYDVKSEEKEIDLLHAVSRDTGKNYVVRKESILNFPNCTFSAYWGSETLRSIFSTVPKLNPSYAETAQGQASGDDFRFVRTRWELPLDRSRDWRVFAKGGDFFRYYCDWPLTINWSDGALVDYKKLTLRSVLISKRAEEFDGREALVWNRVNEKGFNVRALPLGSKFADKAPAIFPIKSPYSLLGVLCSRLSDQLCAIQNPNRMFEVRDIASLPIPSLDESLVEEEVREIVRLKQKWHSFVESSSLFSGFPIHAFQAKSLRELVILLKSAAEEDLDEINSRRNLIDGMVDTAAKITSDDNKLMKQVLGDVPGESLLLELGEDLSGCNESFWANQLLTYSFGVGLGRWDLKELSEKNKNYDLPCALSGSELKPRVYSINSGRSNKSSDGSPLLGVLVDDESHACNITTSISSILKVIWPGNVEAESQCCEALNVDSMREYFLRPKLFFNEHLKMYTSGRRPAPLFWPLQLSSGRYTLWIFYQSISDQILFSCVNDFVEPKIKSLESELMNLPRESSEERTGIDDLVVEMREFKDELLKIAGFWKPDIYDGVMINAAPLWKFFQHKPWQKKLKKTWDDLEEGKYEWSHMAFNFWPERVLYKCHEDRSIAIAHDVESDLWEEVEVKVGKTKKLKLVWKPKEMTKAELDAYIKNKVTQG